MLTLFSIPKPFAGHIATVQWNALRSWSALPGVQVVLVGDEAGVAAAAHEAGVAHVGGIAVNDYGTPLLDDVFSRVEAIANEPLRCFVNADIVLSEDLLDAARAVAETAPPSSLSVRRSMSRLPTPPDSANPRPARTGRGPVARRDGHRLLRVHSRPFRSDPGARRRTSSLRQLVGVARARAVDRGRRDGGGSRRPSASRLCAHPRRPGRGPFRR